MPHIEVAKVNPIATPANGIVNGIAAASLLEAG